MSKIIVLETFSDLDDALYFVENHLYELWHDYDDLKAEISLIDGMWRVGVISDSRQKEIVFDG